ncbi:MULTISPECIES: hypothetical protein [Bartonella]|nr:MULTISPECIES: hypothetical protein [Bartonella]
MDEKIINNTQQANAGATVSQLKELFGWTENSMALFYTQTANKKLQ